MKRRGTKTATLALAAALLAVAVVLLCLFMMEGWPFLQGEGLPSFLFNNRLSLVFLTIAVTLGAVLLAVPPALLVAIFVTEFAPHPVRSFLETLLAFFAALPSVVYGFFGFLLSLSSWQAFGISSFLLPAVFIMACMIFPTIAEKVKTAIQAVPAGYRDGSKALGATTWQTTSRIVLPEAKGGLLAAILLGFRKAFGELVAVLLITGNFFPLDSFQRRTGAQLLRRLGSGMGLQRGALLAIAIVLLLLTLLFTWLAKRLGNMFAD